MQMNVAKILPPLLAFLTIAISDGACNDNAAQQTTTFVPDHIVATSTQPAQTNQFIPGICGDDVDLTGTEYVQNSPFHQGLESWQNVENNTAGNIAVRPETDNSCGSIVSFTRENSGGTSGLIGIQQSLAIDRNAVSSLKLQMVMKIDYQQLTSDGFVGGEAPVFVVIDYDTAAGDTKSWTHGFLDKGSQVNYPDRDQTIMPSFWYQFNLTNVFGSLPDAVRITGITVGGNGQDFRSSLALVSLRGKS